MNHYSERQLKDLLTMDEVAEAPADLAERIKAEIPEDLGALPAAGGTVVRFRLRTPYRVLAVAATLLAVVGASFYTYRLTREPAVVSAVAERQPGAAGVEAAGDDRAPVGDRRRPETASGKDDKPVPGVVARQAAEAEAMRSAAEPPPSTEGLPAALEPVAGEGAELSAALRSQIEHRADLGETGELEDALRAPLAREEDRFFRGASPRPEPAPTAPRLAEVGARAVPMAKGRSVPVPEAIPEARSRRQVAPSTGGSAEPNDAPYGDVFFDSAGVNPFVDTDDDALSTFGLDVDTGSYTIARRYLLDGHLPPPESVRIEEFVNYFDYRDEPPAETDFAIHAEAAPSIFGDNERYYLLRFNVRGRDIDAADRPPAQLVFVVDVSGSMDRDNRLGLVKKALALLLDQLRADDRISLVVYGSRGRVLLEPTADRDAIRRAIDALRPEGSTNAEEGLRLAYELAARHLRRGTINRVILCSDGVANVGRTSAGSILEQIRRHADQGVELTAVGFGMGNYNDTMMERLADTGNGRYAYVDSLDEARRIFVEDLEGTLQTIAAEARVQVEFNPEVVSRYRLLGYENRDIADRRFRDDSVDAGEIGAGHTVTALYEIKLEDKPRRRDEIATLHLRWASAAAAEMVEISRVVTGREFAPTWDAASPALRLTSLVAEFGELLKQTYWARGGDLDEVFRRAQQVSAEFAGDREVADFVSLVGRAAAYRRQH